MVSAVYARQSVEKKNSLSIEGQIDLCQRTAGGDLRVYSDRGYSGKNADRPAFQDLLRDIQAGKIDKLYVYRLDRFSRSVADFGRLWEILQANRVEFVSVSENFDTATPMGRAMLHIIMVFAQLERETTAERVKDNYYRRAALGSWPGGPAPFGFSNGRITAEDGRSVPTLVPNEKAEIVLRIFEAYGEEEASLGSVARLLNAEGIPSSRRGTWDNVALSRVLHCPAYVMADEEVFLHFKALGAVVTSPPEDFDGRHGVLLVGKRDKAQKKYTDVKDHSVSILNSPGFVPADLWLRCQNKLARNRKLGNSGKGTHTWLTGLLKCARCGYSVKVLKEPNNRRLVCSGRYNLAQCDAAIGGKLEELETAVAREIEALLAECRESQPPPTLDEAFKTRLEELDRKADRLIAAFAESSDLPAAYLRRALGRLEAQRQALLEEKHRAESRLELPGRLVFGDLNFQEKKQVAARFIRRIDLSQDGAEIHWNV